MKKTKIIANVAKCLNCGEMLESYTTHDFKTCSCGNLSVDGGLEYIKRLAKDMNMYEEMSEIEDLEGENYNE